MKGETEAERFRCSSLWEEKKKVLDEKKHHQETHEGRWVELDKRKESQRTAKKITGLVRNEPQGALLSHPGCHTMLIHSGWRGRLNMFSLNWLPTFLKTTIPTSVSPTQTKLSSESQEAETSPQTHTRIPPLETDIGMNTLEGKKGEFCKV